MRRWSILGTGLGFGLFAGALSASPVALWAGIALSIAGMVAVVATQPEGAPRHDEGQIDGHWTHDDEPDDREGEKIVAAAEREARVIRAEADRDVWVVWRQDDNGNRFEVARVWSHEDADALAATMESRGHRQTYWVATA